MFWCLCVRTTPNWLTQRRPQFVGDGGHSRDLSTGAPVLGSCFVAGHLDSVFFVVILCSVQQYTHCRPPTKTRCGPGKSWLGAGRWYVNTFMWERAGNAGNPERSKCIRGCDFTATTPTCGCHRVLCLTRALFLQARCRRASIGQSGFLKGCK